MEGAIKQRCSPSLSKHCTWLLAEQIPYCADVLFLLTLSQVGAQAGDVPFQGHRFASIQRWQPSCRSDFAMSFLLAVVQRNAPVYFFQLQKDLLSGEKTTIALRKEPEVQLWKKKKQLSKLHRIGCVGRKILLTQDDTAGAFWRCVLWSGNKESATASCSCLSGCWSRLSSSQYSANSFPVSGNCRDFLSLVLAFRGDCRRKKHGHAVSGILQVKLKHNVIFRSDFYMPAERALSLLCIRMKLAIRSLCK